MIEFFLFILHLFQRTLKYTRDKCASENRLSCRVIKSRYYNNIIDVKSRGASPALPVDQGLRL